MAAIELLISVQLDAVPGLFHTPGSAKRTVEQILNDRIGHYQPQVVTCDRCLPGVPAVGRINGLALCTIHHTQETA